MEPRDILREVADLARKHESRKVCAECNGKIAQGDPLYIWNGYHLCKGCIRKVMD